DAADVVAAAFDLARVHAGADADAEIVHRVADRHRALDRARRTVDRRQQAVAGVLDDSTAEARDLVAGEPVVAVEEAPPLAVADRGGLLGRPDDVGEEHGPEEALARRRCRSLTGEKRLDLVEEPEV